METRQPGQIMSFPLDEFPGMSPLPHYSNCGLHKCHRWSVWLFCSGTLEASLLRSLWKSSLGRNSLLSQTGLKSKQTPYLDELSFFLHIFNCLILKNTLTTVFQIDWTEGSAHRQDGRNGGSRKVFHPHPHWSSLFLHSLWLVITIQLYLWSIMTRASDVRLEKYYPGEKFALHPQ